MKSRQAQFSLPENSVSSRHRVARISMHTGSREIRAQERPDLPGYARSDDPAASDFEKPFHPVAQETGTGGRESSEHLVWTSPLESQKSKQAFEPLIGSTEAAKLLGNIHVKTLQRYARQGSLPGYQIGGHWFFRTSELDAWLQTRISLTCQSVR